MIHSASYGNRLSRYFLVFFVCALLSLTLISVAPARRFRPKKLPDKGVNFGCHTCHIKPGGPRNPFGKDYEAVAIKAGDVYTEALGKMDSDGDGFTNDEEFAANTHPGDAASKPGGKIKTRKFKVYLYNAGRYLALVGFVLVFIQYVLSSKIKLIEKHVGLDKLFIVHRKVGMLGVTLIFFHPISLFAANKLDGYNFPLKLLGISALLTLLVAAGAAILYSRLRLKYETWKNIHRASYAILPLAFVHSLFLGSDLAGQSPIKALWLALAYMYVVIIIYKLWNMARVRSHPFKVTDVVNESHDVTSLYFEGNHGDYKPGQFLIVQLVRDGKVSESHPFTISSSPTGDKLSISVKSVGDFTSTIGDTKVSDGAYIDAPYGRFSFLNHDDGSFVFIAGGIGVTPFISMLRYMYDKKIKKNVTLIWGNKTEEDIVFKDELEKMAEEMPSLKVVHVMSKQEDWPGEKGYIDAEKLRKYISNFQEGQFFLCGPPVMMGLLEKTLRNLGVSNKRIHYERFALR